MSMESLEFVIYPDGRIKERVTGIIGRSCEEVTAAIEAELGQIVSQEKTADYFAPEVTHTVSETELTQNQAISGTW
jgi:Holliday junction resolvasome RuvABC endonuclease subunit